MLRLPGLCPGGLSLIRWMGDMEDAVQHITIREIDKNSRNIGVINLNIMICTKMQHVINLSFMVQTKLQQVSILVMLKLTTL